MLITIALATAAVALFLRILVSNLRMWRVTAPKAREQDDTTRARPSITIIRPVKGMDVGCRENTAALLAQDYPGEVETLFVFDSASDPAYPIVSAMVAESGKNARVLLAGARPARRTGKLNAMIYAFAAAQGELIAFSDSDSRPSPSLLRELVDELLKRPDRGATFAPAVTLGNPASFAEVVYGLMINSWYGASAAEMAGEKRELPFIMGQVMVLRREALDAIGGLEAAEGQLVDDMFLGAQMVQAGYRNVMVRSPLHLVTGPLGFSELSTLLSKWMTFARSGLPAAFVHRNWLRGVDLSLALTLAAAPFLLEASRVALLAAAPLGLWIVSQVSLYRRLTGARIPLRFAFWVPVVAPFLAGVLMATSGLRRSVVWRGQSYKLNGAARLLGESLSATTATRSGAATTERPRSSRLPQAVSAMAARVHHTPRQSVF
jgi:ceramide glucosyltransferase